MDYEDLYLQYQALEKALTEKTRAVVKLQKSISKEMGSGDLVKSKADLSSMNQTSVEVTQLLEQIQSLVTGFDTLHYFESGLFVQQMLNQCKEEQVDVVADSPNFEMFPYKVRIDAENQEVYLDRKKLSCMRPSSLVKQIKEGQAKLMKATFNAAQFANELSNAYDLCLIKMKKAPGSDVYLQTLYKFLVPMSRFRKDYDQQSFAFDVARLYASASLEVKDGRHFQFGPSRNNDKALRILDKEGQEQFLATIRFY